MKLKTGKILFIRSIFRIISLFIIPNPVNSNPSSYFEEKRECIENPDFITPSTKEYKYCIKENGIIKKYDEFDNLIDIDIKLDELVEEKIKKN